MKTLLNSENALKMVYLRHFVSLPEEFRDGNENEAQNGESHHFTSIA